MSTIGIDYTPAYEQGAGIGRYVRELINALAQIDDQTPYRLFVAGINASSSLPTTPGPNFSWRTTRLSPKWLARIWHRAHVPLPIERWTGNIDLVHATDFVLPPVRRTTRTILTVHDLSFVHVPETTSPGLKRYLDAVVPRSVSRADHILADSQSTKDDLIKIYNTPADKVTVLLSGVDSRFRPVDDPRKLNEVRQKYRLGTWPFLFAIGTVQPRKNYTRICEALSLLRSEFPDLNLVIAGGKGWLDDPIYENVRRLQLEEQVHFIGFAEELDLPVLYSAAVAVPFVSLYEGFGLPVLEAMACGTPVIASNISSIPEVAGDAAVLVDPRNSDAISAGIRDVLITESLGNDVLAKGLAQAA